MDQSEAFVGLDGLQFPNAVAIAERSDGELRFLGEIDNPS
jgi:hypothetical protein